MYTNISWMSLWGIDPKVFLRSMKVAQRGRPFSCIVDDCIHSQNVLLDSRYT